MLLRRCALALLVAFAACDSGNPDALDDGGVNSKKGAVHGAVTLAGKSMGAGGVVVGLSGSSAVSATDDNGSYFLPGVNPGTYTVTAQKPGYTAGTAMVTVAANAVVEAPPIDLLPAGPTGVGDITGVVTLFDATKHDGTTVTAVGTMSMATSDVTGAYTIKGIAAGTYDLAFAHTGYVSQTVHDVVISSGTYTVPRVVLTRAANVLNGHTLISFGPAPSGQSADLSQVLVGIDNDIFVVPEATGTPIKVSGTTNANGASFSPDGKTVLLTFTPPPPTDIFAPLDPETVWLSPADGSSAPVLVSSNVDSNDALAFFSPDSSHVWFDVSPTGTDPNVKDWYSVASNGTGAAKLVTQGRVFGFTSGLKQVMFSNNLRMVGATPVEDVVLLNPNAGTASTIMTSIPSTSVPFLGLISGPLVLQGITTETPHRVGKLFVWRPGDATAIDLGTHDADSLFDYGTSPGFVYVTESNFDVGLTEALSSLDLSAAGTALVSIAAHAPVAPGSTPNSVIGDPSVTQSYASRKKMLILDRNGANRDVKSLDLVTAQPSTVLASASLFGGGASTDSLFGAGDASYIASVSDATWLLSKNANGDTLDLYLWDGAHNHLLEAAVGTSSYQTLRASTDGKSVAWFASPAAGTKTQLTFATVPGIGAATTRTLPPATVVNPSAISLAEDGSVVAYADGSAPAAKVHTVKTDGSAAAIDVATSPNLARAVSFVYLTINKDQIFFGDQAPAVSNTFRTAVAAASTPTAIGNLGSGVPGIAPLADGKRLWLSDTTNAELWQVDLPAVAAVKIAQNVGGLLTSNNVRTRFFYHGSDLGGANLGVHALGTTGSTAAIVVAGDWVAVLRSPDGKSTYFIPNPQGAMVTLLAFKETGEAISLANQVVTSGGFAVAPANHIVFIDQTTVAAVQEIDLCAVALDNPLRTLVAKNVESTTFGANSGNIGNIGTTPGTDPWFAPDGSAIYAFGNVHAFDGMAPSFTLGAYSFASSTAGALGTDVFVSGSGSGAIQFDPLGAELLFPSSYDSLQGSYTLSSAPIGSITATALAPNVLTWTSSPFAGTVLAGTQLVAGVPNLFAGSLTAASTTLGPIASSSAQIFFSGDEKSVFAVDQATGTAYAGKLGTAGLTTLDVGVIANGLFPDATGKQLIELARHPGDATFFVGRIGL